MHPTLRGSLLAMQNASAATIYPKADDRAATGSSAMSRARRLVAEHFRSRQWHVVSASDFRSALDLAAEHQPHVIVTEVTLVDARGPHFVRALKTVIDHDVRVIAVTDVPAELVPPRAFDMFFAKPADLDAVSDYIEAALSSGSPGMSDDVPTDL